MGVLDEIDEEGDAGRELSGGPLESPIALDVVSALARGIGNAPVDRVRVARELGANLTHAVTQAHHVVEGLARELAQVLGASASQVDPALAHRPDRVRMQRLRMAAGAPRFDPPAG